MKRTLRARTWTLLIAVWAALMLFARPVHATFPGKNGGVAFRLFGAGNANAIHLGSLQLTNPQFPAYDFSPSVSPDGTQVAFLRQFNVTGSGYIYILSTINADGTNLQSLTDTEGLVAANDFSVVTDTAWANDGRLSFIVHNTANDHTAAIYTRDPSGGLVKTVVDTAIGGLSWSPIDKELVYGCTFRKNDQGGDKSDLCIWDDAKQQGQRRQVPIDYDGALPTRANAFSPKWTADGERILFSLSYVASENGHDVSRLDIFAVNADGGGLTKLTDSGPDLCPTAPDGVGTYAWDFASPSPDGGSFAVDRLAINGWNGTTCDASGHGQELYVVPLSGGAGTLLVGEGNDVGVSSGTDWQAIPTNLIVEVDDGQKPAHPLKGLRLAVETPSGDIIGKNTTGGTYTFDGIPDGTYTIRATLIDWDAGDANQAAFDIRHTPEPGEAVWLEKPVKVKTGATLTTKLHFQDSPALTATSITDAANRERLDDMATIYWRTRQFVDWVKANLTSNTGERVEYFTFAEEDPIFSTPTCDGGGNAGKACNVDTDCPGGTCLFTSVGPNDAYYQQMGSYIVFGTEFSKYDARSGVNGSGMNDEAPENGEWHEFTHHLYNTFAAGSAPCTGKNHWGYLTNPDTCDSMSEGFAMFLPAFASHDIDGTSDSYYDQIADLEFQNKAWDVERDDQNHVVGSREDTAVASLFWDLTDANIDADITEVIGQDGAHHAATYIDTQQMSLADLWATLTTVPSGSDHKPKDVHELRKALGTPAITEDLDGDGVPDIAPLDDVFLMHGFFPVLDQQVAGATGKFRYDVGAFNNVQPTLPRDGDVGLSDHRTFSTTGVLQTFPAREHTPIVPNANVAFTVSDASGRPLSGATVDLTITYPGVGADGSKKERLGAGNGSLVHLELPSYIDYLPPLDASLPDCDPSTDVAVDVSVQTTVNGYVSTDTASFDNCTYWHAVTAATGNAAFMVTSTFPDDSTPPVSTIISSPTDTLIGGATVGVWIVRFTCDDPADTGFASGCEHTEYVLDGGPLTTYRERVIVGGIGSHTLQYRSVDAAGNQEAFQSVELDVAAIPAPTITSFSPTTGIFGTEVTITGTNLDRTTGVSFNGVPASFRWLSWATQIAAVVPVGATTGPITVTTTGGTATTPTNMTVIQPPTITGFSPTSGVVGSLITVTGTNFDTTNNAYIGGNNAGWRVDSSTQVTLLVLSGDTTGPIQIQTQAGTATSATNFVVLTATTTTTSTTTTTTKAHKTTTTATQTTTSTTAGSTSTTTTTMKGHKTTTTRPSTTTTTTTIGTTTTTLPNSCSPSGTACSHNADCCSGTCTGKTKTCK